VEFRIKALDRSSSVISCVVDAVDETDARRQIALQDLKVISLEPLRRLRRLFQPPQLQLAVFSQQLVSLLDAGLSLVEALEALAQLRVRREVRWQHFDRHCPLQARVPRFVDLSHPAGAQRRQDLVGTETGTG